MFLNKCDIFSAMSKIPFTKVLSELKSLKPSHDPAFIARYVGAVGHEDRAPDEQSKLQFLGLKVPQVDSIYKRIDLSEITLAKLRSACLKAKHHEELSLYLALLEALDERNPLTIRDLEPFIAVIDNWATSDQLSSVIARAFEREQTKVHPTLKKWSQSKNPWMRRQSLVSLYYYASQRSKYPQTKFVIGQLERLIEDPHFYVQKGVGWTLRELYNADPNAQLAFVRKHLKRISGTAWFATAEKYPLELRKKLVLQRRKK